MLCSLTIAACSSIKSPDTLYPFVDHRAKLNSPDIKRVMLATVNYGLPSRQYLQSHEQNIDEYIAQYLKKQQLHVYSSKPFEQLWRQAENEHGTLYNRTTGQNTQAHQLAYQQTLTTLFANNPNIDAIIFTDLIEIPIRYQYATQRNAEWHGVQRRIKVEGLGEGAPIDFNLAQEIDAISLAITVVDRQQRIIFKSIGGIQVAQALVLGNKTTSFQKRRDLLSSKKDIQQAIEIAFHPLIKMKGYPNP